MDETIDSCNATSHRKNRFFKSTIARMRRQTSKIAKKFHLKKALRESLKREKGIEKRLSKEKRHLGKTT